MKLIFSETADKHFEYWKATNPKIAEKIKVLLKDMMQHPFSGIGKPEPLKGSLSGIWSRRINHEHRLLYEVKGEDVVVHVLSMRYHYK